MLELINRQTGEIIDLRLDSRKIKAKVEEMPLEVQAEFLSQINFVRRITEKFEKLIKGNLKEEAGEFDDEIIVHGFKLKKVITYKFNKKALEEEASEEEKELYAKWLELEAKYKRPASSIKVS